MSSEQTAKRQPSLLDASCDLPRFVKALVIEENSAAVLDGFAQWHYPGTKWNND
ncbi:hypothetical protein ACUY26_07090 [Corynebacterium segmentosum]